MLLVRLTPRGSIALPPFSQRALLIPSSLGELFTLHIDAYSPEELIREMTPNAIWLISSHASDLLHYVESPLIGKLFLLFFCLFDLYLIFSFIK